MITEIIQSLPTGVYIIILFYAVIGVISPSWFFRAVAISVVLMLLCERF